MPRNEFFRDFIVTSPEGIWVDGRAYATLNAAVAAVGANEQTIVIASEQVITTITIPINVTLKFERNGSISNSAAMIILTTKIIAPNRQIFTGVGNIAFSWGSELRSSWFASFEEAVTRIAHADVTLIVSEPRLVAADCTVGAYTSLKWESPNAMLTVNPGTTVDGLQHIEAGSFQLFAGAGTFTFDDHCQLKLSWFPRLRSALTWIDTSEVVLHIDGTHIVDFSDTAPYNISFDFKTARGHIEVLVGLTLVIKGDVYGGFFRIFSGDGTVICPRGFSVSAVRMTGLLESTLDFGDTLRPWPGTVSLQGFAESADGGGGEFHWDPLELKNNHDGGTIIDPHHTAFPGDAAWYAGVGIGGVGCWKRDSDNEERNVKWFGATGDGVTDDYVAISGAVAATGSGTLVFPQGTYLTSQKITVPDNIVIDLNGSTVRATAVMDYVFGNEHATEPTQRLSIFDGFIDGNDLAVNGIYLYRISMGNTNLVERVFVTKASGAGIRAVQCQGSSMSYVRSDFNSGSGFYFSGCNSFRAYSLTARYNSEDGIYVTSESGYSGAVRLICPLAEDNDRDGLSFNYNIQAVIPNYVWGAWIEQNGRDGVRGTDSRFVLESSRITGVGVGTNYGVHLISGGPYYVSNNYIARESGNVNYAPVYSGVQDDSSNTNNIVGPNTTGAFATYARDKAGGLGTELVTNGDVETGDITGWSASSAVLTAELAPVHGGLYSLKIVSSHSGGGGHQNITLVIGSVYEVTYWVYRPAGGCNIAIRINDGMSNNDQQITQNTYDSWIEESLIFYSKGTSGNIRFMSYGGVGTFYVDDITVKQVIPTLKAIVWVGGQPLYNQLFATHPIN